MHLISKVSPSNFLAPQHSLTSCLRLKGSLGTFGLFMGEQGTGVVNDMWMAASQHHWLYSTELIVSSNTCTWQIHTFSPLFNCGRNQDVCPSKQRNNGSALFLIFFTQTYVYAKTLHTHQSFRSRKILGSLFHFTNTTQWVQVRNENFCHNSS